MTGPRVLVVDDEAVVRDAIAQWLTLTGFEVAVAGDAEAALAALGRATPDVVLSDVKMPRLSGLELMRAIHRRDRDVSVVLLTAHGDVDMAVAAMRDGAFDFLQKPYEPEHLAAVLRRAAEQSALRREVGRLRARVGGDAALASRLIGLSEPMRRLREAVAELAAIDADAILTGETGTGKEVVARCLHDFSPRASGPYVAVNCAAIPAEIFESELFGHEAGAFTGARGQRIGKFEHANGGTILLDEIESMPVALQAKVLRVLQERTLERLGSNREIGLDIRVLAASKADLEEESRAGRFRADLYYRLNTAEISLPPLRARDNDVLLLFEHFAAATVARTGRPLRALAAADVDALLAHDWPGNVRQLKTVAERHALGLTASGRTVAEMLDRGGQPGPAAGATLAERVAAFEKRLIEAALREHGGSIAAVTDALDVPRRTLNEKMARYGISRGDYVEGD